MSDLIGRAVRRFASRLRLHHHFQSAEATATRMASLMVVLSLLIPTPTTSASAAALQRLAAGPAGVRDTSEHAGSKAIAAERRDALPPTLADIQPPPDLIFADGFESGNFSGWSSATTGGGDLSVSAGAALAGAYGMRANINDNTSLYVTDQTPATFPHYRARFYFDPNSIAMASGNAHYLFYAYMGTSTVIERLELRSYQGDYQIRLSYLDDTTTWKNSAWFLLRDQPHLIETEYLAATADGANNGRVALWLDGVLVSDAAALNNDTRRIDFVRLGPVAGIDTGTRGVYYFDAFESRSETYIGEDPTAPPLPSPTQPADLIFGDGLETASLIAWSASAIDGGDLSVSESAKLVGFAGLQALLDDNNSIYLTDWSPVLDPHYRARFYFDPNSITMASGNAHYLLDAYMDNGRTSSAVIFRLEFRYYNGAYQIRATGMKDNLQTSSTPWAALTDAQHLLELEWWAAGAPGSNDGGLYLYVDGARNDLPAGIDNDTLRVDSLRFGAVSGIDTGTRGTYYFDAFQSRRFDDIGPVGSVPQQSGASRLLFDDRHPSLFTGQLRYAYPVWTPPGRTGMTPAVTLAYASGVLDGWIGDVQAPWVGAGWNLDGVEIVRRITTSEAGYGYLDQYDLTFNGVSHELIADPSTPGRYHTQEESFLSIQRHSPALGNAGAVANATGEWWEVVARDGTRYRLGWNTDAEQRAFMPGYSCTTGNPCSIPAARYAASGYAGIGVDVVALRWRVDRVLDRHGNFMTYAYTEEPKAVGTAAHDRASHLASIRYSGHQDGGGSVDLQPGYEVRFVLAPRPGDSPSGGLALWETADTQLLDRIEVCYGTCATGTIVRTYDLAFDVLPTVSPSGTLVLTDVTASSPGFSEGGQTVTAAAAPIQEFAYELMGNMDPGCGGCQQRAYPRLTQVENGYGGSVTYIWENDSPTPDRPYAWRAAEAVTDDGLDVAAISRFVYENPAYPTGPGLLIGYGNASETSYEVNGTTPILTTRRTYGTSDPDIGRETQAEWRDGSGTALRRMAYQWTTDNTGLPAGVFFRYVEQETRFERSGGSLTEIGHTTFTRSAATGNLTQRKDYQGAALHRTIDLTYAVNSDPLVWILDRVATQLLRDSSGNLKGEQRFYYDASLTAPPTLGDLTLSQARTGEASATADIAYSYDAYGNATEVRAYEAYGTAGTAPSGSFQSTTVGYDPAHRAHPISVSNALDHETTIEYIFSLGVPYRITDPNDLSTSAQYDGLGRTRSTTAPGFASPTVETTYPTPNPQGQVPAPYSVETEVWDTLGPGGAAYRSAWTIYDGLGMTIQSQAEDGGQLFVRDVGFNAQFLVQRQGIARTVSGSGGTFQAPAWGEILYVETAYDALGRPIEIEQPDGATMAYDYSGLTTSEIDPNGHKLEREYDALGRQIEVREYSGEDPSFSLYAATAYLYDVADRLTRITDALSHPTNLVYDWLGRKTSMEDPNAGDLSYVYDPLGNLLSQTDARGCTAALAYDDVNRLTGRTYSGPGACGTTPSVSVSYDATAGGNLGLGRRTGMTDASGTASWLYTDSGRTVQETRTVSGAPTPYQVTTESDWMGRPDTLTYPDSEQVSYTYDTLGRPDGMGSSAAGSLADLAYTANGLLSETALGNGVLLQNCYRSDNLRLESRRAYTGSAQECNVSHPEGAAIDFHYAFDPVGNITSMDDAVRAESFTYSYDFLDRLVEAGGIDLTSFVFREQRSFSEVGVVTQLSEWNGLRAGAGSYQETYSGFWFLGSWSPVAEPGASAGAYLQSGETGARVRLAFTGGGFNYIRPTGPDQGIAEVYLDGQLLADADNYSATPAQQVSTSYAALPTGNHLVEIRVSGRKNAASTGQAIGLDVLAVTEGGQQASVGGGHLSALAERPVQQAEEPTATSTETLTDTPTITAQPSESGTPTLPGATKTPTETPSPPGAPTPTETPTPLESATPTPTETATASPAPMTSPDLPVFSALADVPLSFIPNEGQAAESVLFHSNALSGDKLLFMSSGVAFIASRGYGAAEGLPPQRGLDVDRGVEAPVGPAQQRPDEIIRLNFVGANSSPDVEGVDRQSGAVNYILGNNPARWAPNLPIYSGVVYRNLYPGVDLHYEGSLRALKGTFFIDAGVDPGLIEWTYQGTAGVAVDEATGDLFIEPRAADCPSASSETGCEVERRYLAERAPNAWQEVEGVRSEVAIRYVLRPEGSIGLDASGYDPSMPLVIDPVLDFSSYFSGNSYDHINDVDVDTDGNVYLAGATWSTNFVLVDPVQTTNPGTSNPVALIMKLNPTCTQILFSTYLGGSGWSVNGDEAYAIDTDNAHNMYVTGRTYSSDFPLVNPIDTSLGGFTDAFVAKIAAAGSSLLYGTYLGGYLAESAHGITASPEGNAYVTGRTSSTDFPVHNAIQPAMASQPYDDAFVSGIPAAGGSFLFSTYLGGNASDSGVDIALDGDGGLYVAGSTNSTDFPLEDPLQASCSGCPAGDGFVTRLESDGSAILYSTYFGGSMGDSIAAIEARAGMGIYIAGNTQSADLPTAAPLQGFAGGTDGFVARLSLDGTTLVYGTYIGGALDESVSALALDETGNVHVVGTTKSSDFPVAYAVQGTHGGAEYDGFATKLNADGTALAYSTYLGGSLNDFATSVAVDRMHHAYVAGWTGSTNFPLVNPLQGDGSTSDGFVSRLFDPSGFHTNSHSQDPEHPHAVSEVQRPGGTDTYSYDDSGNLTARTEAGTPYTQTTNAEGRLVRVENTGTGEVWTFATDGDGNQIKRTNPDATSTLYLAGGLYEVSLDAGGQQMAVRRYYLLAGQRLAMRDASGTSYLLTDHIGSMVAVLDGSGAVVGEQRYKPFGQPRLAPGIGQTDIGFTGQKSLAAAGLQDFNARWLDTSLGMFAAPDSLIANPYNPQSLNPYGYVMNNPLRYTDPTGLYVFEEAPTDKYVSVSDPRVRYATKSPESKALAPAPKPATASPSAPGTTGGAQDGTGVPVPQAVGLADDVCEPNTSRMCTGSEYGVCVPGLGCSGYSDGWWTDWYLPRLPGFLEQDLASIGPLGRSASEGTGLLLDYLSKHGVGRTGPIGVLVDAVGQSLGDQAIPGLTPGQQLGRVLVAIPQGLLTGEVSSAVGMYTGAWGAGATTVLAGPEAAPIGYVTGYIGGAVSTLLAMNAGFDWVNQTLVYPAFGLGPP